jgi:hypothetical protein
LFKPFTRVSLVRFGELGQFPRGDPFCYAFVALRECCTSASSFLSEVCGATIVKNVVK